MLRIAYFRRLGVFAASPAVNNHTLLQLLFIDYAEAPETSEPHPAYNSAGCYSIYRPQKDGRMSWPRPVGPGGVIDKLAQGR